MFYFINLNMNDNGLNIDGKFLGKWPLKQREIMIPRLLQLSQISRQPGLAAS
jgi:hypothetical protein